MRKSKLNRKVIFLFLLIVFSCQTNKKEPIKTGDNPNIEFIKYGDNIEFYNSDFDMGDEAEINSEGLELAYTGNYNEAKIKFKKALLINPKSSITLNNLGNLERELKNFPEAIKYFNSSLVYSDSTYFPAAHNLGRLYALIGESENAEKKFNLVIEKSGNDFLIGMSYFDLTVMYYDYGWIDKAKFSISKSKKHLGKYDDFDKEIEIMELYINNYYN